MTAASGLRVLRRPTLESNSHWPSIDKIRCPQSNRQGNLATVARVDGAPRTNSNENRRHRCRGNEPARSVGVASLVPVDHRSRDLKAGAVDSALETMVALS